MHAAELSVTQLFLLREQYRESQVEETDQRAAARMNNISCGKVNPHSKDKAEAFAFCYAMH